MVRCIHLFGDEVAEQLNTASKGFVWFSFKMDDEMLADYQDTA